MSEAKETWIGFMDDQSPPMIALKPTLLSDGRYNTVKLEAVNLLKIHPDRTGKSFTLPDEAKHMAFATGCRVHGKYYHKNNETQLEVFVDGLLGPDTGMFVITPSDVTFASGIYSRAQEWGGFMLTLLDEKDQPRPDKICLLIERFTLEMTMPESMTN